MLIRIPRKDSGPNPDGMRRLGHTTPFVQITKIFAAFQTLSGCLNVFNMIQFRNGVYAACQISDAGHGLCAYGRIRDLITLAASGGKERNPDG